VQTQEFCFNFSVVAEEKLEVLSAHHKNKTARTMDPKTRHDLEKLFLEHIAQTSPFSSRFPVVRAEGCYFYDSNGKEYIDFIAGIAVTNAGHCHPRIVQAVEKQIRCYAHTMVYGEHIQAPQVELAARLVSVAPPGLNCVYFLTTGAEANDAAIKMAAKLTGRKTFCAFHGAYHGDTVGAASCFGHAGFRAPYDHILLDVRFLTYNSDCDFHLIDNDVAAVIVEPIQGEGGIIVPSGEFLTALRRRCDEVGSLLIFDEVQTAFGRIGKWFAAQKFGIVPDVITLAKALGAGYPLAALLGKREMLHQFAAVPPFSHITTFGGHPVSCAAGLAGLQVIEEEHLLSNSRIQGEYLKKQLERLKKSYRCIVDVRGLGLMIGVEMESDTCARRVVNSAREKGLILETTLLNEAVIRMSPPLIVTKELCDQALVIFEQALAESA
jgi:4-aminobutyrate aminotransferase-like enzyme